MGKWPKIKGNWDENTLLIGVANPFITSRGPPCSIGCIHSGKLTNMAGWKMDPK